MSKLPTTSCALNSGRTPSMRPAAAVIAATAALLVAALVHASCAPRDSADTRSAAPAGVTWATTAGMLPDPPGQPAIVDCPPGGTAHTVWGSGIYTGDSSVCTAAVHAGLITLQRGGTVRLNRLGAQPVYGASAQNGITTTAYGEWRDSFAFLSAEAQPLNREAPSETPIVWNTKGDVLPRADRATQRFTCPPGGTAQPVWGSGIYTGDSSVCTAAVHAGLITLERGGIVRPNRLGAQHVYGASVQNGITTTAYGEWRESFGFLSQDGQPLNQDPSSGIAIVWNTKGDILPPTDGASQRFICPPGGTAQPVWGTDIYTADSSICTAAVHAGRIGFERGGVVTVTVAPGQASYARGERNGVVSSDYGSWGRSLVFTSTEGRPRAPSS